MLIVCPTCASEFTIEAEQIGPTGRVVRCAKCRGAWFVPPVDADRSVAADAAVAGRPRPPRRPNPPGARQESSRALLVLALGLACVIGLAAALRTTIVRIVPESAAAFNAVGLSVNLVGLQLGAVTSEMVQEPGGHVLVIAGEIVNETVRPIAIPPLALTIEGAGGELLYNWSDKTNRGELAPHGKQRFQARLSSPPPEGQRVVVAFSAKAAPIPVASR